MWWHHWTLWSMLEDCKYVFRNTWGERGEAFVRGVHFWNVILVFADEAFCLRTGWNRNRWDSGGVCSDTDHSTPGSPVSSAAASLIYVPVAVVQDVSTNNDVQNSAVEQKVGDEKNSQENGNCELWWNVLLLKIWLDIRKWCRVTDWRNATRYTYGMCNRPWPAWRTMRLLLIIVYLILSCCILTILFQPPIIAFVQHIPCLIGAPFIVTSLLPILILWASNIDLVGTWVSLSW